ncbi:MULTISPECIES: HNH endonuclease [unclassified Streptomyces]|nr:MULTISPECIES: HNH endonuclease [unclassified Streptomyces]MYR75142.1 hypothetical protein [Streptomyces sp. SID4925]
MHLGRLKRTGTTDAPAKQTLADRFWAKVDKRSPDECWEWTAALNEHGYGVMRPEGQRTGPTIKAHRVSVLLDGRAPEGLCVLHRCDNPPCVNPSHLFLGTKADNAADRDAKGRGNTGEVNGQARLTVAQVLQIRARAAAGELQRVLAAEYGISRPTVSRIVNGHGWTHIA